MISKSFLKSSFIYTLVGALPMVSSLLLLPFYTNYLSTQLFVSLGFYISISMFFQILFSYSVDSYYGVKYTQLSGDEPSQKQFTGTISNLLIIIAAIILLAILIVGPFLFTFIFKENLQVYFWPFGFLSIVTAFFNAYFKTCTNAFIYFKKAERFFWFNVTNFILTLGLSIGGLFLYPDSLIGPIYARLISGGIIFVMAFFSFYAYSGLTFNKDYLKELHKFCAPFLIYVLASWGLGNIDRYFLKDHISAETLAAYDLLLKCFLGIEFLQNGLSAAIFPKLFELWNKNKKLETTPESNRYFNVFGAINIILLTGFCIVIPFGLKLIVSKGVYFTSFDYIGIIAGGYATRSILNFYLSTILYSKNTWLLVKVFSYSAVFQIAITYFLVNEFGLKGALYAGVITKVVQVLFSLILTKKIFDYNFNVVKIYLLPLAYLITNVVIFSICPVYNPILYFIEFFVFSLLIYFTFKNEIKIVLNQYLKK